MSDWIGKLYYILSSNVIICIYWGSKANHKKVSINLFYLLENCPVLNRSDNRELYIHLDTMTPLR